MTGLLVAAALPPVHHAGTGTTTDKGHSGMRFFLHCAALLLIGLQAASAQPVVIPDVVYPRLPAQAASAAGFAPAGWRVEAEVQGDLNADGIPDIAFTLRAQDRANVLDHRGLGENPFDSNPRILAAAFGRPGGGYALALADHGLIPRRTDPVLTDAFDAEAQSLAIQRGTLRLRLEQFSSAGSWDAGNRTFTFRWQEGRFALIGFDRMGVQRNSGQTTRISVNYLTRRMQTATGNIETNAERSRWTTLPPGAPLSIGEIGDGMDFDPAAAPAPSPAPAPADQLGNAPASPAK
ncbi:MAG TPA: hypothetical protein VGM87_04875 [Roseomonas sp.]|jgi:hypothetical protein